MPTTASIWRHRSPEPLAIASVPLTNWSHSFHIRPLCWHSWCYLDSLPSFQETLVCHCHSPVSPPLPLPHPLPFRCDCSIRVAWFLLVAPLSGVQVADVRKEKRLLSQVLMCEPLSPVDRWPEPIGFSPEKVLVSFFCTRWFRFN